MRRFGAASRLAGATELGPDRVPELVILPTDNTFRLVWVGEIATLADSLRVFLDAHSGEVVQTYSIRERQGPTVSVGHGIGVLQDTKKISTMPFAGAFVASDPLRPSMLNTFDMRSNVTRVIQFLNGIVTLNTSDLGSDTDNDWTDAAIVDAHVYAGFTYDYYFKRFGRQGLDNANIRVLSLVHPVSRDAFFAASPEVIGTFYINAFYAGSGIMVYGEGLPQRVVLGRDGDQHRVLLPVTRFFNATGAGVGIRYSRASLDFGGETGATTSGRAGGLQITAGVRFRF